MKKVSVIIPAYNAEKTIERTLRSVFAQHCAEDVRIIVVNDGSKDDTEEVCRKFLTDRGDLVLNQKNSGQQPAIRNALKHVDTPYVMFLDADDAYAPEMVGTLLGKIESEDFDCVLGGYVKCRGEKREIALPIQDAQYDRLGILNRILIPFFEEDGNIYRRWSAARWDKIYKTEIVNAAMREIQPELVYGEDLEMALRVLWHSERVASMDQAYFYEYTVNDVSMAHCYSGRLRNQVGKLVKDIRSMAEEFGMEGNGMNAFEDNCTLILLTELSGSKNIENASEIRKELLSSLHDPKYKYKLILQKDFPMKSVLQKIYRKLVK